MKVNREVGKFAVRSGGLALRHVELEEKEISVYRRDGVHLNKIGLDIFNMVWKKPGAVWGEQRILRCQYPFLWRWSWEKQRVKEGTIMSSGKKEEYWTTGQCSGKEVQCRGQ